MHNVNLVERLNPVEQLRYYLERGGHTEVLACLFTLSFSKVDADHFHKQFALVLVRLRTEQSGKSLFGQVRLLETQEDLSLHAVATRGELVVHFEDQLLLLGVALLRHYVDFTLFSAAHFTVGLQVRVEVVC